MAAVVENFDFGQRLILLRKMGFTSNNEPSKRLSVHTNIIGDIESGIQQHLTVVDRLLQRMEGLGSYVGVGVRVGMYPFASIPGFISIHTAINHM